MVAKRALATLIVAGTAASCGSPTTPDDGFDRKALLANLAQTVIEPAIVDAEVKMVALSTTAQDYAASIDTVLGASIVPTQRAWRDALQAWQRVELLQFGPAGRGLDVAGSRALRDEIYSWPATNACRIDQELVAQNYDGDGYFDAVLNNVYGLDAMERLLFVAGEITACANSVPIISDGSWTAIDNKETRRARYSAAIAEYSLSKVRELKQEWAVNGSFRVAYESGTAPYSSVRDAVDQTFAAMFYLDRQVKDQKLAAPLGLGPTCTNDVCPELVESPLAGVSLLHLQSNLQAFEDLFVGGAQNGIGFDDFLVARGAPELAEQMRAAGVSARQAAEGGPSLIVAAQADLARARSIHTHVKTMADLLKSQFITVLGLTGPGEGAADND